VIVLLSPLRMLFLSLSVPGGPLSCGVAGHASLAGDEPIASMRDSKLLPKLAGLEVLQALKKNPHRIDSGCGFEQPFPEERRQTRERWRRGVLREISFGSRRAGHPSRNRKGHSRLRRQHWGVGRSHDAHPSAYHFDCDLVITLSMSHGFEIEITNSTLKAAAL
jgi:hypothetical protein